MSTTTYVFMENEYHNICFHGEIKYQYFLVEKKKKPYLGL